MSWRKYLVRGLVFSVLGVLAAGAWVYQHLTHPTTVRQQVIAKLEEYLIGAHVRLDSAGLRLLGGISVTDLRLIRRGDPDQADLLHVPSCVIYHDKEQVLDGKLAIRKIEMHRPRFHIIRGLDGVWNVDGVLGPVDLNVTVPTIVIHQGTFLVEDRLGAPGMAPVEIKNVNLSLINDPLPTLDIQLQGSTDLAGTILIRAFFQRANNATTVAVDLPRVPVGPPLVERLAAYCDDVREHARQLQGTARLHADFQYQPGSTQPWTHTLDCKLTNGKLSHPQLPLDLEDLEAAVHCNDGQVMVEKLTARSGATRLEVNRFSASALNGAADLDGGLRVTNLTVNAALFERLPDHLRDIHDDFRPEGTVDLDVEFHRHAGQWQRHSVVIARDLSASFVKFPYPLLHLKGQIEHELNGDKHINIRRLDLVGSSGSGDRPVHIKGEIVGDVARPRVQVDIWGEDFPLDDTLRAALSPKHQELADSFHPSGKGDVVAFIRREKGARQYTNRIVIHFHDVSARYKVFPYPLEEVSGTLDIQPDHWEFRDFTGSHKGCTVHTHGRSQPVAGGDRLSIEIGLENLQLDEELESALRPTPRLQETWKTLALGGKMNVLAQVEQLPDRPDDMAVTVTVRGCTMRPTFFPYSLDEVGGTVRYVPGRVELDQISGRHGATILTLDQGVIQLNDGPGFRAWLTNLKGSPLVPDAAFLHALPETLQKICTGLKLQSPIGMLVQMLFIDMPGEPNIPPIIYWDGGLAMQDAKLETGVPLEHVNGQVWCRGRHNGHHLEGVNGNLLLDQAIVFNQPLKDLHSQLVVTQEAPEVLELRNLTGHLFGGNLGGQARVEFGPTILYSVNLTAMQVKLEEFGRHNLGADTALNGEAVARLVLKGQGTDLQGVEGEGRIDVPSGKMYNLPLLLDLLKFLALHPPDRTAFEEAHATFSIRGPRVQVHQLELNGNAISLSGSGELNLDGSDLQLDFYAFWGRIKQVLPPVFRDIPPAISQQLLKIKMRGKVTEPKFGKEPIPGLVDPLEKFLQRMAGKRGPEQGQPGESKPDTDTWRWPGFAN